VGVVLWVVVEVAPVYVVRLSLYQVVEKVAPPVVVE